MRLDHSEILDLELEIMQGGWNLETQQGLLDRLKGHVKRYPNRNSQIIADEAKAKTSKG